MSGGKYNKGSACNHLRQVNLSMSGRKKCKRGSECNYLRRWLFSDKKSIRCKYIHTKHEISEAEKALALSSAPEPEPNFACWHCSSSENNRNTCLFEVEHDTNNQCKLANCKHGENCKMFKYLQNSCFRKETIYLMQCIYHCKQYGHKISEKKRLYQKVTNALNDGNLTIPKNITKETEETDCSICSETICEDACEVSCGHIFHSKCISQWIGKKKTCPNCRQDLKPNYDEIKEIISREGFDINHTEEKNPKDNPINWAYDKYTLQQWNSGYFHLLHKICNICDLETFQIALSCRDCKLDEYTLMECIKKGDVRYLDLIGKGQFAKHPALKIPVRLNDYRFVDNIDRDLIDYQSASSIVNNPSYESTCRDWFKDRDLFDPNNNNDDDDDDDDNDDGDDDSSSCSSSSSSCSSSSCSSSGSSIVTSRDYLE